MGLLQSSKNVFIVGIKGVAMAGLARMLTQMGKQVSGSDTDESQITDALLNTLHIAHSRLDSPVPHGTDLVIYAAAHGGVESRQVKDAQNHGISVISQAGLIAELISMFPKSIAVCGSHGKTTTSSLTAFVLHSLGVRVSWLVGAPYFTGYAEEHKDTLTQFPGGHFEKDAEIFVFEADEYGVCPPSDKTPKILLYNPTHIICTNIDFDHPDIYRDVTHVQETFDTFFTHAKHVYQCNSKSLEGNQVGIRSCLADLGLEKTHVDAQIARFGGVARRLEFHGARGGVYYYDDYAHHPAEIQVTIQELHHKHPRHRLIVLFQSHTYSRTQALKREFVDALSTADIALIDTIFPSAREKERVKPISAKDLELLAQSQGHKNIYGFLSREEMITHLKTIVRGGDVVVTVGAGDIYKVIPELLNSDAASTFVRHDFPISDKFTWKVKTTAKYFAEIATEHDLSALVTTKAFEESNKLYILGRGANTLFACDYFDGLVVEINNQGIEKIKEDEKYSYWKVAAGEDWVNLVERMVITENLGGLENLAYIPGKVGSAPIQNIAAYGQVFEDICQSVEYIELPSLEHHSCAGESCEFSYRNSKFKKMLQTTENRFIIWSVVFKLAKPSKHTIATDYFSNYESLQSELRHLEGKRPTIKDIYHAVVALRKKKLPEVSDVRTNGSLFMNPIVQGTKVKELLVKYPKLQYYPTQKMRYVHNSNLEIQDSREYKIAAGHIFDEIGWKGKRVGQVGTWKNHALVLCNYGTQDPGDIIKVIQMMQQDFEDATGIRLEPEINIVQ